MYEGSRGSVLEDVPTAVAVSKRRRSPQLVWLIPIVAALIGGWLAVKTILDKGPTITISFKTAEGLEAGKTKVKYKNVDVGEVKAIKLSKEKQGIVATVELVKESEPYLVDDTRFWVVRPRVAGGQISGLGTLFSGSYIGVDLGKSGNATRDFVGLEVAPIVTTDVPGRQFVLRAENLGSLEVGSPVFFLQEAVGSVTAHEVNKDGRGVTFKIFVNAPYDQYVTADSRFWNASGIDVSVDAAGVKIDTQSIVSILIGGIAFETFATSAPQPPAEENHEFHLANSRAAAMKRADAVVVPFQVRFNQTLRGLSIGAPVEFRGITIGEVKGMNVELNAAATSFLFPVTIDLYPNRLLSMQTKQMPNALSQDEQSRHARWDAMVAKGMRAQLRTGNLLTGQLYIDLDFFPNAPEAHMDWTTTPPTIPSVAGGLEQFQATLTSIATKIDKMQFEEIGKDVRQNMKTLNRALESADKLVKRMDTEVAPTAKATLEDVRKTLKSADQTLSAEAPLQQDLRVSLRELSRAAQSLRQLTEMLERQPESLIKGKKETRR